jgi:hypothetical protein
VSLCEGVVFVPGIKTSLGNSDASDEQAAAIVVSANLGTLETG